MKKISTIFAALAILLTNIMCVVVTNLCTSGYHAEKHHFTSAPWEVGFLFIIAPLYHIVLLLRYPLRVNSYI